MSEFFAIRHRRTGALLPQTEKGASWWEGESSDNRPRLFSKIGARNFINIWVKGRVIVKRTPYGSIDEGETLEYESRGRSRSDLEIIPVTLTFGEPL